MKPPDELAAAFRARDARTAAESDAVRVVHAPGRVNLIGDHTDYNDGFVLPAAIDLGVSIAFVPTGDQRVEITLASSGETLGFDLAAPGVRRGDWRDYVLGVAVALREAGAQLTGFRGLLDADLPIGAGLSSSAALELAAAWALGGGDPPLGDRLSVAQAAQRAENTYVGVACGIMDQYASAFGVAGAALLLDCRSLEHSVVPLPLDEVALVVCDSKTPRRLLGSAYGDRRAECARAVQVLQRIDGSIRSLREASLQSLEDAGSSLGPVGLRRARHVITESARVSACAAAFEARDLEAVGELFAASHASLRDDFDVSTPELDRIVAVAGTVPGVIGARLTGAGFGGAVIIVVRPDVTQRLAAALTAHLEARTGERAAVWSVVPAPGARRVWPAETLARTG